MILAEIVFASRLLGLVAGEQHVAIQVDAEVRSVEVRRDGHQVASLHAPPWHTVVDFGPELTPHELTVVAFDAAGHELGRDTQPVNTARPPAELGVLLDRDAGGRVTASIRYGHFAHKAPKSVDVKLDGRAIRKDRAASTVSLGVVDASTVHVLSVNAVFPDGVKSRKEIVFGGGFSEQMPAELTPVAVRQRKETTARAATCFQAAGKALPQSTVERGPGSAMFIFNGSGPTSRRMEAPTRSGGGVFSIHNAEIRVFNPVPTTIARADGATGIFDSRSGDGTVGTKRLLANAARVPQGNARIADAVGAAGLSALRGGHRRVVVVVLGNQPAVDRSVHSPAAIRRYLQRVGVPLRVWSLAGPRTDVAEPWGEIIDVSTSAALLAATEDLRKELDSQRVAWLPVAPLDAFRVTASDDCAYAPLAVPLTPSGRAASAR
jgi:hypothetical protein